MTTLLRVLVLLLVSAAAWADVAVERVPVPMPGWPQNCAPARLVALSDIHAASTDGAKLDGIVQQVQALKPEVVALLGDYRCDREKATTMSPEAIAKHLAPLAKGSRVLYIMGNHDTGDWGKQLEKAFQAAHFEPADQKLLRQRFANSREVLFLGESFRFSRVLETINKTMPKQSTVVPFIVLAHSPYEFLEHPFPRIDLVLAGHTHGGQVCWPNGMPMRARGKLTPEMQRGGMHRMPTGKPLYITRGLGESQTPVRLNCPREITLIELVGK